MLLEISIWKLLVSSSVFGVSLLVPLELLGEGSSNT